MPYECTKKTGPQVELRAGQVKLKNPSKYITSGGKRIITLTITAETPVELAAYLRGLTQNSTPAVPPLTPLAEWIEDHPPVHPPEVLPPKPPKAPKPEPRKAPKPEPPKVPKPETPEAPKPEPLKTDGPISEAEAVELRVLCEKFCAVDKEGKKKIQAFLKEHNVQRITVLPESLIEEFKKVVMIE